MLINRRYRVDRQALVHMKNLLEGYDNLAVMTILDGSAGFFALKYDASMADEVSQVLGGISGEPGLEELQSI